MKILVINEPFIRQYCRCQRWPARTRARALRPPANSPEAILLDFVKNNAIFTDNMLLKIDFNITR